VIISIQGVRGSFHEEAAAKIFGNPLLLERDTFDEVFNDCSTNRCDYAIAAIENSIVGSLIYNYDRLFKYDLNIVGETYLRISHNLIAAPGTSLHDITEIWSHPMAIEQCRAFLATHPAKVVEMDDTAGSVKKIMEERPNGVAAIAGSRSADIYGANILMPSIETDPHNYTRFLVLSTEPSKRPAAEKANTKTSLVVRIDDKPGSLYDLLGSIRKAKVNLTKIESRPRVGVPWNYDFYLDLSMDADSAHGIDLLESLSNSVIFLKVLGSYPNLDS
jgi:prephenate dehydratase